MAYTANHDTAFAPARSTGRFKAILARIGASFVRYGELRARTDEIQRLNAMSDAQLAKLGLTRDGIVRHVFRDQLFL